MILSVSRRTDIPAFYSDWFFNRIKEGFVCVRNPMNIHQISKIKITPDIIDCIVFWTKNPEKMLERITEITIFTFNLRLIHIINLWKCKFPEKERLLMYSKNYLTK